AGGIYNEGAMTVVDGAITGNQTFAPNRFGGGIASQTGALSVSNSAVRSNTADVGGGIYVTNTTSATVDRTEVSGNTGSRDAGGIYNEGAMTVVDGAITGNQTFAPNRFGGGIASQTGALSVSNSAVRSNTADVGGGIYVTNTTSATVDRTEVSGNTGSRDGG